MTVSQDDSFVVPLCHIRRAPPPLRPRPQPEVSVRPVACSPVSALVTVSLSATVPSRVDVPGSRVSRSQAWPPSLRSSRLEVRPQPAACSNPSTTFFGDRNSRMSLCARPSGRPSSGRRRKTSSWSASSPVTSSGLPCARSGWSLSQPFQRAARPSAGAGSVRVTSAVTSAVSGAPAGRGSGRPSGPVTVDS